MQQQSVAVQSDRGYVPPSIVESLLLDAKFLDTLLLPLLDEFQWTSCKSLRGDYI